MGGHNVNQYIHRLSFSVLVEFNPRLKISEDFIFISTAPEVVMSTIVPIFGSGTFWTPTLDLEVQYFSLVL